MFDFVAWHNKAFDDLMHGGLDLVLNADNAYPPSLLQSEVIYKEEFVCAVAAESDHMRRLTTKQSLDAEHIGISILGGSQTIP
jgi:DNA-binding transcriptional LysR family regulator